MKDLEVVSYASFCIGRDSGGNVVRVSVQVSIFLGYTSCRLRGAHERTHSLLPTLSPYATGNDSRTTL